MESVRRVRINCPCHAILTCRYSPGSGDLLLTMDYLFFSSFLLLCFSAALLSFCEASASETVIATDLCSTLKVSPALPTGYERITHGLVVVFAFLQVVRRGRLGIFCFLDLSSFLLLSSFRLLSLRTLRQAITPSHHHTIFPLPLHPWPGGMREAIK